jgi:NTP pyrophosphatase (non-canonical NTP hydrolase)
MRAGDSQRLVRETMIAAGGYWRPLAAVARLLEELGELSELLFVGEEPADGVAAELADLWIITTALADQFLVEVDDPGTGSEAEADFAVLVAAAGPVARVVNHYDGPKVPRHGEPMPTLQGSIAGFHMALLAFAEARRIDLADAVAEKIAHIHARGDIERFGAQRFDPSSAAVLDSRPGEAPARLWGGPDPALGETATEYAARARGPLAMFAKAARAEGLEGVLIPAPTAAEAAWLAELVAELDPGGDPERFELAGEELRARLLMGASAPLALVELA